MRVRVDHRVFLAPLWGKVARRAGWEADHRDCSLDHDAGSGVVAHQLEAVSGHLEPLAAEIVRELRVELADQLGVEWRGQVVHRSGPQATEVIVEVPAGVVSGAGVAVPAGELGRHAGGNQGLERLVDRRQADPGDRRSDGVIDLLGRGMMRGTSQMVVHGKPLGRGP